MVKSTFNKTYGSTDKMTKQKNHKSTFEHFNTKEDEQKEHKIEIAS